MTDPIKAGGGVRVLEVHCEDGTEAREVSSVADLDSFSEILGDTKEKGL